MKRKYGMSESCIDRNGDRVWKTRKGADHRYDGHCRYSGHSMSWAIGGQTHRLDGPARIFAVGVVRWIHRGTNVQKRSNDRMPKGKRTYAMSKPSANMFGYRIWKTRDGNEHRYDGPAREESVHPLHTLQAWKVRGAVHLFSGPAVRDADGNANWSINA